jgi:hypothetical protein
MFPAAPSLKVNGETKTRTSVGAQVEVKAVHETDVLDIGPALAVPKAKQFSATKVARTANAFNRKTRRIDIPSFSRFALVCSQILIALGVIAVTEVTNACNAFCRQFKS